MAHQSRYGWRWFLVLLAGAAWLSIGCGPQELTMFLLPFDDNKQEPEYKLFPDKKFFAEGKDIKLIVLANFTRTELRPDIRPADRELAEAVSEHLRLRSQANKRTLKLVSEADVASFEMRLKEQNDGEASPLEIGKKFKADYVLDLAIEKFGLYQEKTFPRAFGGTAQIHIKLYKVDCKDENPLVFKKAYTGTYTGTRGGLIEVGNSNPAEFRHLFMTKLGREISRMFIAYDPDETKQSAAWE
jgi:hypothetical protein